jgi:hypothetical protein
VKTWGEFNFETMMAKFAVPLQSLTRGTYPLVETPPPIIRDEMQLQFSLVRLFWPVLSSALRATQWPSGYSNVRIDIGQKVFTCDRYTPDRAAFVKDEEEDSDDEKPFARGVGEVKLYRKFKAEYRYSRDPYEVSEYRQVLSQLQYYMNERNSRYGFVITERELLAIRRTPKFGWLEVSHPIPLLPSEASSAASPRLTPICALWYLHALIAEDNGWNIVGVTRNIDDGVKGYFELFDAHISQQSGGLTDSSGEEDSSDVSMYIYSSDGTASSLGSRR